MIKRIIKFQILFLAVMSLFFTKNAAALTSSEVLTTDHFKINFNSSNLGCAAVLASSLETYHEQAASFLDMEILERIPVSLTPEGDSGFNPLKQSSRLYISPENDFSGFDRNSYNDIFVLYLGKNMHDWKGFSLLDKNFVSALAHYSITDQKSKKVIIYDLVNNCGITNIGLNVINQYDQVMQESIYIALTDFIILSYGKKILIQTLKDTDYYGGFYESLSSISGDSIDVISGKFNSYLQQQKSDPVTDTDSKQPLFDNKDFTDTCYTISGNGQIAVLQENSGVTRLLLKNGNNCKEIPLVNSGKGTSFNALVFAGDDHIAITEIHKSGSTIHIYDTASGIFSGRIFLPYLFISKIDHLEEMTFIFSAGCGITSDIYMLDIKSGRFSIMTESGNNYSPAVKNGKAYYISGTDKNGIIEMDIKSGEKKQIFSDDRKIGHLNRTINDSLIFAFKNNDPENIYSLDVRSGNLRQISKSITPCILPQISEHGIYYITFFKNRYRLFFTLYNPADI